MMANQSYSDNVTGSCVEEVARYAAMDLVAPAVQILLMVVVCAGNGLVFVVFWRQPQFHLRSLSHYFILQLAIADFTGNRENRVLHPYLHQIRYTDINQKILISF